MLEVLEKYVDLLWYQFQYDIDVMSQPWMYFCLLIPAFFYFIFILLKWMVLMLPLLTIVGSPAMFIGKMLGKIKYNKTKFTFKKKSNKD